MMFFDRWRRSKTVGKRSRDVRCGMPAARRRLQLEPLEQRRVLSVTINPITGPDSGGVFDVSAGKDLYVPVVGSDQGLPITYNASSSDPNVQVSVLTGNPTLQFSVSGTDVNGAAFSGTMTFQLFENIAPQTVQGIINQVNAGLYDGSSFYRMETSPTFQLIQGGIEMTSGKSDTTVLPDEFNVDATFNSSGLLAMANAGLGTATSEFFVTAPNRPLADDPQALNFGYTIFGQLITGQDIYDKILNVPTTSSNGIHFANNAVTITSASIITDFQDAVLQISEPNGYTGTSTITVTGLGSDSSVGQQSFVVSVAAPATSQSSPLLLDPVINRTTSENQPVSFQISASDFYGDPPTFTVTGADSFNATPANVTVQVTPVSNGVATVTLTPANGFTGTISLVAHAEDSTASLHDAQAFRLTVSANFAVSSVTGPINSSNETNTSASGTGTVGDTISAVASDGTNSTAAHTTTVDANGNWSISGIDVSSLADGTITYTVNDTTNAASGSKTSTKDTVAPAVSITSVTNPITQANQTSASASGTGEVGATISLVASDGTNLTTAKTTTVDANGNWSISSINLSSLADGAITFSATATDAVGNMAPDEMTATKDTAAPAVAITSVTDPITIASRTSASASGTGEVGATISLVASDGTISTTAQMTTVDSNGDWSISLIDLSSLADGTITFTAAAADSAGNTGSATATATKTTIVLTTVTGPVNAGNVASASASGAGEAGASVSLVVSDGTNSTGAYTTTIAGDGTWSISGIDLSALADGPLTYTATATDQLENSAVVSKTASKDTVAPSITLSSVTDPVNLSDANNVSASGTSEAGATISVAVSDGTNSTTAQTTTADASGNWSISGIDVSSLADGTITFTATATDAAGNSSSTDMTAAKDTVAPAVAVTTVTNPVTLASHTSAAASGTGEVGAAISLVVGDGTHSTIPMTTTVDANGNWSVSGIDLSTLADGTITFTATATDEAGNTAQSSMTATKTTVAVTVVTNPVNSANVTSASASGTGEVGATVSLVVSDGTNSTTPMTTTVDANGNWSISGINLSALADGTLTYTATASDSTNNMATATKTASKDTVAPAVSITSVTNPITSSDAGNTSASGTGEAGATISLVASDGTSSTSALTTTVDANGTWSISGINVSALADGTITYTATSTDAAGNSATTSQASTKQAAATASLSGTVFVDANANGVHDSGESALAGVIITLRGVDTQGNAIPSQTTTTASDGSYSFANLPAGTYSISEAQPAKISDGSAIVGNLGGSAGTNLISGVSVPTAAAGSGYDFSEKGLANGVVSQRLFLASAPSAQQTFNNTVAKYGTTAPVVTSIVKSDAQATSGGTATYTVTFNETVTGVDAADFALATTGGVSGASIASVTGSGATYTVTVNTGSGHGNLGLNLVDQDSIFDLASSPLGGAAPATTTTTGPPTRSASRSASHRLPTRSMPPARARPRRAEPPRRATRSRWWPATARIRPPPRPRPPPPTAPGRLAASTSPRWPTVRSRTPPPPPAPRAPPASLA